MNTPTDIQYRALLQLSHDLDRVTGLTLVDTEAIIRVAFAIRRIAAEIAATLTPSVGPCTHCGAVCEDDAAFDVHQCLPPSVVSPQAVQVTDQMVKTALDAYYGDYPWDEQDEDECPTEETFRSDMRRALESALAAQPQAQPPQDRNAARYLRLRAYGCAPMGMGRDDLLQKGLVCVGTNLDELVDQSLASRPLPPQESPAPSQACEPVAALKELSDWIGWQNEFGNLSPVEYQKLKRIVRELAPAPSPTSA